MTDADLTQTPTENTMAHSISKFLGHSSNSAFYLSSALGLGTNAITIGRLYKSNSQLESLFPSIYVIGIAGIITGLLFWRGITHGRLFKETVKVAFPNGINQSNQEEFTKEVKVQRQGFLTKLRRARILFVVLGILAISFFLFALNQLILDTDNSSYTQESVVTAGIVAGSLVLLAFVTNIIVFIKQKTILKS